MEMNREYASKGVAGAALGTGIAGTALGVLNSLGGMAELGGLFNNNRRSTDAQNDVLTALLTADMLRGQSGARCVGGHEHVTQRELDYIQQLAAKDAQIAKQDTEKKLLEANTYTDQKLLQLYQYFDGKFTGVEAELAKQAVQNQATKDSFQLIQERLECVHKQMEAAIKAEAKERRCNDNTIVNYVNATFYPKMVADVTTGTGTTAQSTYNPLPVCDCDC